MKREIKFRGKRLDNGEWIYSDESFVYTEAGVFIGPYNDEKQVDPDTVGQYTGLKDRNGKEIFEGDILQLLHKEEVVIEHGLYGWTFYNPQTETFYNDGSHTYKSIENYRFMFGTGNVVGNIHDNPEWLKGGER